MNDGPELETAGCLYIGIVTVAFFAILMVLAISIWMLVT